jgi:hypothetical protein
MKDVEYARSRLTIVSHTRASVGTRAVLYQCKAIWRSHWNLIAIGSRRVACFRVSVGVKIEKWQSQSVVHGSILVGLTQPVPGRHTYPLSRKQALSLLQRGCLTRQFLVSHTMEMTVHVLMLMLTAQRWFNKYHHTTPLKVSSMTSALIPSSCPHESAPHPEDPIPPTATTKLGLTGFKNVANSEWMC